ncbi:glycosyltransferase family 2 protein [Planktotalea sp.]|uniref:glycosyltransferase family 2 protein n=1 Tax=Planktotalea sp. TaxID=2029877 RepID=UPI003D6BB755
MTLRETSAVVACMRNEGPFILEWVAYHRVIGFDKIVICSNDCTDGSAQLLDALQEADAIVHLPHTVPANSTPQDSGIQTAFAYLSETDTEWLAHIDADEFINIGLGDGTVSALLASAGEGDVIALPWWAFGDSGHIQYPGNILEAFTLAEDKPTPERSKFKSMFRFRKFAHANDHMPKDPKVADPDVRAANGARLKDEGLYDKKRAKYHPLELALRPEAACINHYAVPSRDAFLLKNDRGDGQGKATDKYYLGSRWHDIANQNQKPNLTIQRHLAATKTERARLRGIPGIAAKEAHCIDWFNARCQDLLTQDQIDTWSKPHARSKRA